MTPDMSLCSPHLICLPRCFNYSATHLLKPLRPKPLLCPASLSPKFAVQYLLGTLPAPLLLLGVLMSAISQSPVAVSSLPFFPPLHQTKVLLDGFTSTHSHAYLAATHLSCTTSAT